MAGPSELSKEAIKSFMLDHGGKVTNHELVKYFKPFLTDPETRVEARNLFKEYVNDLATMRNEDGEKYLILKKKHRIPGAVSPGGYASPSPSPSPSPSVESMVSSPGGLQYVSSESLVSPTRQPPPYRPPPTLGASPQPPSPQYREPPPPAAPPQLQGGGEPAAPEPTPPVPPRRKSSDRIRTENKENIDVTKRPKAAGAEPAGKEGGAEDEDSVSLTSEPKAREWLVAAAQGNHMKLAKLAQENPRLASLRDPTMGDTALHWGAKHGNAHIVKMMAGTYHADVNARSNGGYTPLHLATQFGYEEIANLLVNAYGADQNLRDYSGRKARQYQASQDTSVSADTFRKIKARKKQAEKDLGFLRIGSLNVRVKKTTEAFSNFLGVGINSDKIHKTWGSADNIQQVDRRRMPPPKAAPLKKRRSRHGAADFTGSYSTPSTPPSQSRTANSEPGQDSDSDTACGFGNNWQGTV
ncbi:ankyrin repeat domain-containing protein SOWAHB isoform X2 [Schistocerca piceifrons]|uniref:ankyrin repeat domain-containing protein SOWAHB isoform X2 n=1 Tax=Schistocerca piceifrons TaxID=274613 RepID=UPI001F5FA96F|nr:ankyrin repeat domain-containing protein SOWAHB isoform X2 [Schistocerca piceifrons]